MRVGLVILMNQGSNVVLTMDEEDATGCIKKWSDVRANGRFMPPIFLTPDYNFSILYDQIVGMYIKPNSNLLERQVEAQIEMVEALKKSVSYGEDWKN